MWGNIWHFSPSEARRFAVDDVVMANLGRGKWKIGKVLRLNHREPSWQPGQIAAYLIGLDEGGAVFAPADDDGVVKKARCGLGAIEGLFWCRI